MTRWITLVVCGLLYVSPVAAAPDDVGIILSVKGSAEIISPNGSGRAAQFKFLKRGERLKVGEGGHVVMTFYPTKTFHDIAGPSVLEASDQAIVVVSGGQPVSRRMQDAQVRAANVTQSETRRAGALVMRRLTDARLALADPEPNAVVLPGRASFAWSSSLPPPYELVVVGAESKTEVFREVVSDRSWTARPGMLRAGQSYQWHVSAGNVSSPDRMFSVASEKDGQEVELMRPSPAGDRNSWLLFAAVLKGKGLESELRAALGFISQKWPELE